MNLLTYTSLFPNRVQPLHGIFVYQRVAHVARRPGISVTVVAPVPYFPSWLPSKNWRTFSRVPAQEHVGELNVHHPPYPLLPRISMPVHGLLMYAGSLGVVRSLHAQAKFDCIDAHYVYPDGFAACLLGRRLGIPVFLTARGTDINLFPRFRSIRPMIRWSLARAAGIVSVCEALKDTMVALGTPAEKIRTIGNGVDPSRFSPVDRLEARRRLGLPMDGQIIVSVGALIPRKGFHILIPATSDLTPRYPRLRLYIVGEGELRPELEAQARTTSLSGSVQFVGSVANEDLKYWYSAADLSCLVSSREGWPNVITESLACGAPVIATRVWGAPEILASLEHGLLVEQDRQSIAGGIERGLQTPWDRTAISRYGRSRTWDVVACEVEDFITTSAFSGPHRAERIA